jgi:hypothetical protein
LVQRYENIVNPKPKDSATDAARTDESTDPYTVPMGQGQMKNPFNHKVHEGHEGKFKAIKSN